MTDAAPREVAAAAAEPNTAGAAPAAVADADKHELQRRWSLWVGPCSAKAGSAWTEHHKLAHEFRTAEDFWCMYHHSNPPSLLEGVEYMLFKKDLIDAWDAHTFQRGGRWMLKLSKADNMAFDELWLCAIMACIGEAFEDCGGEDVVSGVAVAVQRGTCTVEVWLSDPADDEQVLAVGRFFHSIVAETPALWEKVGKVMTFEDFAKNKVVVQLVGPKGAKSTAGIFQ
mmetsp:Transcript_16968/g.43319  ORF Transcript_16968/g.43319 Transcript_16968/m.43319 type:complete len:227 (-) Transcript_16968:50-730(-)